MNDSTLVYSNASEWAEAMFGGCDLGDARRAKRAVTYAAQQAIHPGGSIHEVCKGDDAAAEAAYRFMRNDAVEPEALEEGPFQHNATLCSDPSVVLAIQDTTTLAYSHAVAQQLGDLGGGRGLVVHSTLAVDGGTNQVIGLLDQQRWSRTEDKPKNGRKKKPPYEERESYKWELASQRLTHRLSTMNNVIQVCDREADIYQYLEARAAQEHRYVVRARHNRRLLINQGHLWEYMDARPVVSTYQLLIHQRGAAPAELGRKARPPRPRRLTEIELRTASIQFRSPIDSHSSIAVNVVYAREKAPANQAQPLQWMILTSEPIETPGAAETIIKYYESRWLIEEFHKAWKTGCQIEQRRLQAPANLERFGIITAHVAVRLLQLRSLTYESPTRPANALLDQDEWQCLHLTTHPQLPLPESPPSLRWALEAIAKLGGWRDTKRTGRIGWMSLWKGWARFQERLVGWKLARQYG